MIKRIASAILLLSLCFFSVSLPVHAYNAFGGVDCKDPAAKNSTVCQEKTSRDPLTGNNGLLIKIANIIAYVAGAAAVIMILIGSIRFITSGSDISTQSRTDTDVESARNTIVNALIGLAVIILARTIINFVVLKL